MPPSPMTPPEPTYLAIEDLTADSAIPDDMDDADAVALIVAAEDAIDGMLGCRTVNTTTGRKVDEDDDEVEAWQWAKLQRATLALAVRLHGDPDLLKGRQWERESGPEFTLSGPTDNDAWGDDITLQVRQTGLYEPCVR